MAFLGGRPQATNNPLMQRQPAIPSWGGNLPLQRNLMARLLSNGGALGRPGVPTGLGTPSPGPMPGGMPPMLPPLNPGPMQQPPATPPNVGGPNPASINPQMQQMMFGSLNDPEWSFGIPTGGIPGGGGGFFMRGDPFGALEM